MKNLFIDLKNYFKNNRTIFYWVLLIVVIGVYVTLFVFSSLKPETTDRETASEGDVMNLNNQQLTYLGSYYYPLTEEIEVHFGINNIQSLFSENNLNAKAIVQQNINNQLDVEVERQTSQLITMTIKNVPEDYLVSRLTINYAPDESDNSQSAELYITHNEERDNYFSDSEYDQISGDFKGSFLVSEIENLNEEIDTLNNRKEVLTNDIATLESDDALLTEAERESVNNQIENIKGQIESIDEQIEEVKNEIAEREKQQKEIENLYTSSGA